MDGATPSGTEWGTAVRRYLGLLPDEAYPPRTPGLRSTAVLAAAGFLLALALWLLLPDQRRFIVVGFVVWILSRSIGWAIDRHQR